MGCCGQRRRQLRQRAQRAQIQTQNPSVVETFSPEPGPYPFAYFQFLGARGGVTVVGRISGKRYRFDSYGEVVAVDPRDTPSLVVLGCFTRVG